MDLVRRDARGEELGTGHDTVRPAGDPSQFSLYRPGVRTPLATKVGRVGISPPDGGSGAAAIVTSMAKRDPRMIPLGYGKFVRADRIYALVPIEGSERRDGRRTYVHVDGLTEPLVASRSERAILADAEAALTEAAGIPRRSRVAAGQESLL